MKMETVAQKVPCSRCQKPILIFNYLIGVSHTVGISAIHYECLDDKGHEEYDSLEKAEYLEEYTDDTHNDPNVIYSRRKKPVE